MADTVDVVVVGSGASGLTAALAAASAGAEVLVLEKGSKFGGSTALSGGQMWIPNNSLQGAAGIGDAKKKASTYLTKLAFGRADSRLIRAFVDFAPQAFDFVLDNTSMAPKLRKEEPDYHPEWAGALRGGRTIDPGLFDGAALGEDFQTLLHNPHYHLKGGIHMTSLEFEALSRGEQVPELAERSPDVVALGEALVCCLRSGLADKGVPLLLRHRVLSLTSEDGKIRGVDVSTPRGRRSIKARKGVILAAGGFEWNQSMKTAHMPVPSETSAGCTTNTGDGIRMGMKAGASVSLMDEAWWFTLILKPGEKRGRLVTSERTLPGSIMVNKAGRRFANEAMNYNDLGRIMLEIDESEYTPRNVPAFLIFDEGYRSRYPLAGERLGKDVPAWVLRGRTLGELASKLGLDKKTLIATVGRFNASAMKGEDPDFGRGRSYYDGYWGDDAAANPTLGAVSTPPFYAVRILAGDIGTRGGLVTNAKARVLDPEGEIIERLYAAGNNMASVMGPGYAGSGATLGPCLTFGYLGGLDAARR